MAYEKPSISLLGPAHIVVLGKSIGEFDDLDSGRNTSPGDVSLGLDE